jgi:hypothetical protein
MATDTLTMASRKTSCSDTVGNMAAVAPATKCVDLALFAPEVGHTNCKLYEQYKFDEVVKFRAVPEITHRKWKELNLMSPLRPDETPDFKFQELQMKLYYTIYI